MNINAEQVRAVQRLDQDVCVVAGPGTGKTRVLIERYCWLVHQRGVRPDRILAVTFTDKAATEIRSLLATEFENDEELRQQMERACVSTIHGFCTRLLRENAIAAGVDIGFAVLDDPPSRRLRRESAEEALDSLYRERPKELRQLLSSVAVASRRSERQEDLADALTGVYEALRAAGDPWRPGEDVVAPEDSVDGVILALREAIADATPWGTDLQNAARDGFLEWLETAGPVAANGAPERQLTVLASLAINLRHVPKSAKAGFERIRKTILPGARAVIVMRYYSPLREMLFDALDRLDELYRSRKRELAALDFSDLEEAALDLLDRSDAIRERVRRQFDHILMDELQDTNPLQWKIVNRIRSADCFFAVGDINQSIYSFRHAEPKVFSGYEESLGERKLEIDRLVRNYRGRGEILDVIEWLVKDQAGIVPPRLRAEREFPEKDRPSVELMICGGEVKNEAARREAKWIAHRIAGFAGAGRPLKEIAVLGRKMKVLAPIADALREIGIPSLTSGGQTLYETRETRDLLHLLNVLGNVHDEISLAGVIRSPLVGCGDETLFRLKLLRESLWDGVGIVLEETPAGFSETDLERIRWIVPLLEKLRTEAAAIAPDRLLARVIDESGYLTGLDLQGRANVERFLRMLSERFSGAGRSLAEIAGEVGGLRTEAPEAEAPPADAAEAVRLMSIHRSKGLEFPVVFVPALDGRAPTEIPPICRSPEFGIGVKWTDPASGESIGDTAYELVREAESRRRLEEEWRLLYVAMTRAEEHLILSWSTAPRSQGSEWTKRIVERLDLRKPGAEEFDRVLPNEDSTANIGCAVLRRDPPSDIASLHLGPVTAPLQLPPPENVDPHDSTVTITELATFSECPRQYYLRHYLGFGGRAAVLEPADVTLEPEICPADQPAPDANRIGSEVHQLLARLTVAEPHPEAVELARRARGSPLGQRMAGASRTEREFGVLLELHDVVVRGQIDAWFEANRKLTLVDYKTDRFDPDAEPERAAPYRLQLLFYAVALERLLGRLPDEAILFFLRSGKEHSVSLGPEDVERAAETVRALKEAQRQMSFVMREGDRCERCEFRAGMCPVGRESSALSHLSLF